MRSEQKIQIRFKNFKDLKELKMFHKQDTLMYLENYHILNLKELHIKNKYRFPCPASGMREIGVEKQIMKQTINPLTCGGLFYSPLYF